MEVGPQTAGSPGEPGSKTGIWCIGPNGVYTDRYLCRCVSVRRSEPVEKFYKRLFEPNRQHVGRKISKCSREQQFYSYFYAFGIKKEMYRRIHEDERKQGREICMIGLQDSEQDHVLP